MGSKGFSITSNPPHFGGHEQHHDPVKVVPAFQVFKGAGAIKLRHHDIIVSGDPLIAEKESTRNLSSYFQNA